ncbi:hypothetical protein [Paenibacillus sp. FSL K6-2524]|uniref:hypothetical protein n=1 Tax=Paenibacillus sp. FSL K6-2524 TaxID=2954516 RepID=UPI0030FA4848
MGVKHGRDYGLILAELTEAISCISDSYIFFEMESSDWERLSAEDRHEVHEALAEDLFYALGTQSMIEVGCAVVIHDADNHVINFLIGEKELTSVKLV